MSNNSTRQTPRGILPAPLHGIYIPRTTQGRRIQDKHGEHQPRTTQRSSTRRARSNSETNGQHRAWNASNDGEPKLNGHSSQTGRQSTAARSTQDQDQHEPSSWRPGKSLALQELPNGVQAYNTRGYKPRWDIDDRNGSQSTHTGSTRICKSRQQQRLWCPFALLADSVASQAAYAPACP